MNAPAPRKNPDYGVKPGESEPQIGLGIALLIVIVILMVGGTIAAFSLLWGAK